MLDELFMQVLDMTKTAGIVILVVILARLCLKKAPKVISYALWAVVLFRLLCPWNIEAPVSIVPDTPSVSEDYSLADAPISIAGAGVAAYQAVGDALNGGLGVQRIPTTQTDAEGNIAYVTTDWWDVWILFGQYVWIAGIAVMAVYSALSYWKLRKSLSVKVCLRDNIYIADDIRSPFVIGLFRPKIYLPSGLNEREQEYIILHEQHHIRRMDHIWKALAFLALAIHWFNPLVWMAFILASRDMEMSCDEAVIRKLGEEVRADYSASLLTLATGRRIIAGTPLAFGEGDPKSRIKNLAKWKKPILWITAVAVVVCAVLAVCLLTDPAADDGDTANVGITWYYGTVADRGIRVVQEGDREGRSYLGLTCNDGTEMMFWAGEGYLVPLGVTAGDHVMLRGSVDMETGMQIVHQVQEVERSLYDSLDDAINGAILEQNQNEKYERMFACASFVTLAYEGGGPASEMSDGEDAIYHTFYGIALHQVYSEEKGQLKEESGSHIPTVLSFFRTDDGKYVLTQYWQPRDGTYYPEDIRAKFPRGVDPDTQKHIEAQQEECLAQAMEHFGVTGVPPTTEAVHTFDLSAVPDDGSVPLEELPDDYSREDAIRDGVAVMESKSAYANADVWEEFVRKVESKQPARVRIMETIVGYVGYIEDILFDGHTFRVRMGLFDQYRKLANIDEADYKYLNVCQGQTADTSGYVYESYVLYSLSQKDIGNAGPEFSDWWGWEEDKATRVFQYLTTYNKAPDIPEQLVSAKLTLEESIFGSSTDTEVLRSLRQLLAKAEYIPHGGNEYSYFNEDLCLVIQGSDGSEYRVLLLPELDFMLFEGDCYDFGPGMVIREGRPSNRNALLDLVRHFGLEDWPEELREYYMERGQEPPRHSLKVLVGEEPHG